MCDRLAWPTSLPDGTALFSLRPECIGLAKVAPPAISSAKASANIRFRAQLRDQAFHGATELLHIETEGGLILTVRTASRDLPQGPLEFEFSANDAVPVRATSLGSNSASNSEERA